MAKRISKVDTVSHRTAHRGGAILFGLPFLAIGAYLALAGFGAIPLHGKANAPLWVIGCIGVAFGLAGLFLVVSGVRGVALRRRARDLQRLRRDEVWWTDYPWDPERVEDRPLGRVLHSLFGTTLLAAMLMPFFWWGFLREEGPWMVRIIASLFGLVLLWAVWLCLKQVAQLIRCGRSTLRFARFPFHPGERLEVVFSPNRFDALQVTLRFVEERFEQRGSGNNRSTQQVNYEHFKEERRVEVSPLQTEVDLRFELPDNAEWVDHLSGTPVRYWELLVQAEAPGVDFRTTFLLPVYARDDAPVVVATA